MKCLAKAKGGRLVFIPLLNSSDGQKSHFNRRLSLCFSSAGKDRLDSELTGLFFCRDHDYVR